MLPKKFSLDPQTLGTVFPNRLNFKDEFMLQQLDQDFAQRIDAILEGVLNTEGIEIVLHEPQRKEILEMTAIRKAIHDLLQERGSMEYGPGAMN